MCFIKETPWVCAYFLTSLHIKLIKKKTINNN